MEKDYACELVDDETSSTPFVRLWVPGESVTLNEQINEALASAAAAGDESDNQADEYATASSMTDSTVTEKFEETGTGGRSPTLEQEASSSTQFRLFSWVFGS